MDATGILMWNCYNAFFEKLNAHFKNRHIYIRLTGEEVAGKKTRLYQHFTIVVHPNPNERMAYKPDDLRVVYQCKFNLIGDIKMYVRLRPFDVFHGAGDFDHQRSQYVYHLDDIIRSFCDFAPTETCAIFNVW